MRLDLLIKILLSLSAVATIPAVAQQSEAGNALVQGLVSRCPAMAAPILSRPEIAESLAARPIETAAVCSCVSQALDNDLKLKVALQASQAELAQFLKNSKFKSYLFARTTTAVFSCLAAEMDSSLALVSPE